MLKESLAAAQREAVLPATEVKRVNVDTTVQEKAIAFPTDARLYHKARQALVGVAQRCNFKLRQSYVCLGKRALVNQGRYGQHGNSSVPDGKPANYARIWAACCAMWSEGS